MRLRPFLKWVGGKRQLLPVLRRFYPATIGALLRTVRRQRRGLLRSASNRGRLNGHGAVLSDDNADLIGCYRRVGALARRGGRRRSSGWPPTMRGAAATATCRCATSASIRCARSGATAAAILDDYSAELAAMLIYLNRTGYNGLFRVNASGEFNVPPGRYDRPRIVDRALLTAASAVLLVARRDVAARGRSIACWTTRRAGDFAYFDPPYAPLSAHRELPRLYRARVFAMTIRRACSTCVIALARRGVNVLLSNSTAPSVTALYEGNAATRRRAGLRTWRVPARRAVNSQRRQARRRSRRSWSRTSGRAPTAGCLTGCQTLNRATLDRLVRAREWRNWQTRRS